MKDKAERTTILGHLADLRRVLMVSIAAISGGALICYFFLREPLMSLAFDPIRRLGKDPAILGVGEGFMVQLQLTLVAGIVLASPIVLWQIISFILPALYKHEKRIFFVSFFLAFFLFAAGIVFAYVYVLQICLSTFLVGYSEGLTIMISASRYLSFLQGFLLPFGLAFQLPLAVCLLTRLGILTPQWLKKKRKYAILVILVIAMLLTPPDILSQILLSGPLLVLYEISIWFSMAVMRRKRIRQQAEYELAKRIYPLE